MTKHYWVDEFYVELSRNQISQLGLSQNLPPKALAVLTYLAENRGRVVSYEELLDVVWANAVVTPNTLQRSIAQLRKALGENSKAQNIIRTHAKQGYSLECEVKWSANENVEENKRVETQEALPLVTPSNAATSEKSNPQLLWLFLAVILIAVVTGFHFVKPNDEPNLNIKEVRYLTATDDKEFNPTYSNDGNYIVFHRYPEKLCINHLWAKDANNQQEFRLTQDLATYTNHSLSPNGENLVAIQQNDCTQPIDQNICYRLMSINFQDALREPQKARELLRCDNSRIRTPLWVDDNHVALLQSEDKVWRLIRYSLTSGETESLYSLNTGNILNYAWSSHLKRFAVISIKDDGKQYIDVLNAQGELESSREVVFPDYSPAHILIYPRFVPEKEQLVFGDGSYLYTLNFDGEVNRKDLKLDGNFGGPNFSRNSKRMLLIKGRYDSDVASLSVASNTSITDSSAEAPYTTFERSTNHEDLPIYQPNTSNIAYVSERTGREQIWLYDGANATMISNFPHGAFIHQMLWNKDGTSILALVNKNFHQLFLDKPATGFQFDYPVMRLFAWDDSTNKALANIFDNGIERFVEIDLNTGDFEPINNKTVYWALRTKSGQIVYQDHMNRIWQVSELEDKLLEPLTEQLGVHQRFIANSNTLYGVNKAYQLWSFDLDTEAFKTLATVTSDIDYLTDTNGDEILFTYVVAAKKEVIEVEFID